MSHLRPARRAAALLALTASLVVLPGGTGIARTTDDVKGPACADIIDGSGFYANGHVAFRLTLNAPTCASTTETLYVLADSGSTTPLATGTPVSTQDSFAFFDIPVTDTDDTVCVFATTTKGHHVFDRAPDSGCVDISLNGPVGAQRFH